jgi:site-specific DNA recombinase
MLQSGEADVIIAYTIDRFVRPPEEGDEWDMPILIRGLAKLGKEIHTVRRGKLSTGFADLLIAMLDARKAGEERRDIRERSMRGKRAKVKSGKVIGMRAPYGYRHIRDVHGKAVTLEIDEKTARIVRLIFQWYVVGDEHGVRLSDRAIALRLSEMQVPVPGELQRGYQFRKRGKTMWGHSTIRRILINEVYAGVWRYGTRIAGTTKKRPVEETVTAEVPAIIDRKIWERALAQREHNKEFSPRNARHQYLLRGLIRCGLCNMMYTGSFCRGRKKNQFDPGRRYYSDTRDVEYRVQLEGRCANKPVRADAIEADVWEEIEELFSDLERLAAQLKEAQQREDQELQSVRDKLQITDELLKDVEEEIHDIAMSMRAARGKVLADFEKQQDEVNARYTSLVAQREKHIAQLGQRKLTDEAIETLMRFARDVNEGIQNPTFEDKRHYLEMLDVKVTITPGHYHLKCVIGEKDGEISQMKRGGIRIVRNSCL